MDGPETAILPEGPDSGERLGPAGAELMTRGARKRILLRIFIDIPLFSGYNRLVFLCLYILALIWGDRTIS